MCTCIQPVGSRAQEFFTASRDTLSDLTQRIIRAVDAVFCQLERVTIAPLGDLRCGISTCIRGLFRSLIARYVFFSLNELTGNEHKEHAERVLAKLQNSTITRSDFAVSLHAKLSVISMTRPENRHTLVYFPGHYEIWQSAANFLSKLHVEADVNVYAINYRGTGTSSGFPETEDLLLEDAKAFINDLVATHNIPKESICLAGSDIGGAIATLAGSELLCDVISIRSFRSLTKLIQATFPLFSNAAAQFAKGLHWNFDVETALKNHTKSFITVFSENDPQIPYEQSTRAFIEQQTEEPLKCKKITTIKLDEADFLIESPQYAEDPDCNPHVRPLTTNERGQLVVAIKSLWENTV